MKYLGSVTDPKDVATKEYVDKAVPPHKKVYPHTQTFTATSATNTYTYTIPWTGETPSTDELLNFNAYHYKTGGASQMTHFSVVVGTSVITYVIVFFTSTTSGESTIVFQNSFTDSDGTIISGM